MKDGSGFRLGNFYGAYSINERNNSIGIEIGFINVSILDESKIARTFTVALTISHFIFAIGWIIDED